MPNDWKIQGFLKSKKVDDLSLVRVAKFYVEKRRSREELEILDNEFEHFYKVKGGQ